MCNSCVNVFCVECAWNHSGMMPMFGHRIALGVISSRCCLVSTSWHTFPVHAFDMAQYIVSNLAKHFASRALKRSNQAKQGKQHRGSLASGVVPKWSVMWSLQTDCLTPHKNYHLYSSLHTEVFGCEGWILNPQIRYQILSQTACFTDYYIHLPK